MRVLFCFLVAAMTIVPASSLSQIPSMRVILDGQWLFRADSGQIGLDQRWFADSTDRTTWNPVEVPSYWERYPGLAAYDGWGWFARTVVVQKVGIPLSLHFGGVDDEAMVWINGVEVGSHAGYNEPFALNIASAVRLGENSLVVLVKDNGSGGGIYKSVTLIDTDHLEDLLKSAYFGLPALRSADWVREAVIYSVYLRSFSKEGTFAGLEKRVPELKSLGATVLWLLPIHPVGLKNRKGKLGSPYAVQDYYGINPEFGTMLDFKRLLATVHKNGMKLIIDLVANHTSWDSKLIRDHPEWFTKDKRGEIISPNPDWTDVADLDYSQSGLRTYMIDMIRWWVKDVGIDGFRCDVAELVPTDFWEEARAQLNRIKPVLMLSEGSIPEHQMKAFDITYSWNVYDVLGGLLNGTVPPARLDDLFKGEYLQYPTGALRLRFNTNHDKNVSDGPAILRYGKDGLKLSAVLITMIPGVPLIYTGEEVANDRKLSLFEKVDVDWNKSREMGILYKKLFELRRQHKALSRGEMIRIPSSSDSVVYAFFRSAGRDKIFTVFNFSPDVRPTTLDIPLERILPGERRIVLKEAFSGMRTPLDPKTGGRLDLVLEPHGYKVFVVELTNG
jgi:cyclomaltodextrinase / maltogenic alpha-amylase / neopullulanase